GLARGHRIDEAGLSPDVVARGGAFAPHLRVVGRMLGIGPAYLVPPVIEAHSSHPRRCTSGAVRGRRRAGSGSTAADDVEMFVERCVRHELIALDPAQDATS